MLNKINPVIKQFFYAIIANLTCFQTGMSTAWLSPVVSKLRSNQTVFGRPITEAEASWITSVSFLSACVGLFVTGYLSNLLGRRLSLVVVCIPRVVMCFIAIFASRPWMLVLARVLSGLSDTAISIAPTYTSEIANKEIRGAMGAISPVMGGIGVMVMLSFGPYTSYNMTQIVYTCITIATFVPLVLLPETPYFLYLKGKKEDCMKMLTRLRGCKLAGEIEYLDYSLIDNVMINKREIFCDRIVMKTMGKIVIFAFGSQAIGFNILLLYLQTIFQMTNTNLTPEVSSTVSGCIQLFASVCTILLTDRFGRKPLLITSLIGFCVGTLGLGLFFTVTENQTEITGFWNYLPLISVILVIFCNNFGIGSLVYTVIAELFDGPARSYGVALGCFAATVPTFLGSRYFYVIISTLGLSGTYWVFSAFCILTCLFVWLCLPETKGKQFSQIQIELGRKAVCNGIKTAL